MDIVLLEIKWNCLSFIKNRDKMTKMIYVEFDKVFRVGMIFPEIVNNIG